jgi:hypothetical protein
MRSTQRRPCRQCCLSEIPIYITLKFPLPTVSVENLQSFSIAVAGTNNCIITYVNSSSDIYFHLQAYWAHKKVFMGVKFSLDNFLPFQKAIVGRTEITYRIIACVNTQLDIYIYRYLDTHKNSFMGVQISMDNFVC